MIYYELQYGENKYDWTDSNDKEMNKQKTNTRWKKKNTEKTKRCEKAIGDKFKDNFSFPSGNLSISQFSRGFFFP